MHFLDINTFYAEKAGGIKTYHRAKIGYFLRNPEHSYTLVAPGPAFRTNEIADNVRVVEVYGPRLSRDEGGYRLLLDFPRVYSTLRDLDPDVVEVGDPWLSGLFSLALRKTGAFDGLLSSFHHSDAVHAWVQPWAEAERRLQRLRAWGAHLSARAFYALQRRYDVTLVSSRFMERHLTDWGVSNVVRRGFGTDPLFFEGHRAPRNGRPIRMLYAGRLGIEKGAGLLLCHLEPLLDRPDVELTVLGRGKFEPEFAAFQHPRFRFMGYVGDRPRLSEIYRQHDVFLAPGPHETFGLGVLEAMASGLVVVGPDRGGTAELLTEAESPFIFSAGDGADFVRVAHLAADAPLPLLARGARATAERYGEWDEAIGRMVQFYEDRLFPERAYAPAGVVLAS